jgi:cell division protein FtsI (penicillin-binding protein 3)
LDQNKKIISRSYLIYFGLCFLGLAIICKIFYIQFVDGSKWHEKEQHLTYDLRDIPATRGNIYSEDGSLLVTSIPIYEIRMDMKAEALTDEIFHENIDSLSLCLANLFKNKSKQDYKTDLLKVRAEGKRYYLVNKGVTYTQVKLAKKLPIFRRGKSKGGVIFEKNTIRKLPFGSLASRTIGIERKNVQPIGLEGAYNIELKGKSGKRYEKLVSGGVWMPVKDKNEVDPQDGADIYSTIDINLQDVANKALEKQLQKSNAHHGSVILMEVETGYIRSIANLTKKSDSIYVEDYNYAIGEATEPGSTFKLASLIAALEDGKISITDTIDTKNGQYKFYDRIMKDSHEGGYGRISIKDAFMKSSNVGISRVIYNSYSKNPQQFIDRLNNMNLNEKLGIEIDGEGAPKIKNTNDKTWSGVSLPWMSIGYELLQTPLHILTFYNAIANEGKMVKPLFVSEVRQGGQLVKKYEPVVINPAICSKETIKKAKEMMESVVQGEGTASNLKNPNYTIAGKTGTAQIANQKYGYKYDQAVSYQASFVGYFPADKPKYSCIVVINGPSNNVYYGNQVAGPIFKEIADKVFARGFDMHKEIEKDSSVLVSKKFPVSTNGSREEVKEVFNKLKVPIADLGEGSIWARTFSKEENVELSPIKINSKQVPNVAGMGLQDALYILENLGLDVQIIGEKGMVIKQSIAPGTRINGAMVVKLQLST